VILRVKKRGDGRSASPTVRLKGERALGERGPWELFGGVPRRCGSASVVQRPRGSRRQKMRRNSSARARDGRGGDGFGGGGGEGWFLRGMVLRGEGL
jgi:hypothetical protein